MFIDKSLQIKFYYVKLIKVNHNVSATEKLSAKQKLSINVGCKCTQRKTIVLNKLWISNFIVLAFYTIKFE